MLIQRLSALWRKSRHALLLLAVLMSASASGNEDGNTNASAETLRVAVAANFYQTASEILKHYPKADGQQIELVSGASGVLATQILHGAPFGLFLSADDVLPQKLIDAGRAEPGSKADYALGQLVLWTPGQIANAGQLQAQQRIAIANPAIAPYGRAAMALLNQQVSQLQLVRANNVAQVYQFVLSGNVAVGLLAQSQVLDKPASEVWKAPANLYPPIRQQLVVIKGPQAQAASEFRQFILSAPMQSLIANHGYGRAQ